MSFEIQPVPPVAVIDHWGEVKPLLASTMPSGLGRFPPENILLMFMQGTAQAWFVLEKHSNAEGVPVPEDDALLAVAATRIDQYPTARTFSVFALGGIRLRDWFGQLDKTLTEFAVKAGCTQIEIAGRKGWEKLLGFPPMAHLFVKNVEPGMTRTAMEARM